MNTELNQYLDDEVNLIEVLKELFRSKVLIFSITGIFSVAGVIYSLMQPNQYSSTSVLTIRSSSSSSQTSSSLSSLASRAGVNIGSSSGGANPDQIVLQMVKSKSFFKHLIGFDEVLQNIYAAKSFDTKTNKIIYDSSIYKAREDKWIKMPKLLEAYEAYENQVSITHSKITGMIYLSVTHKSPIFSKELADLIISELNNLSRIRASDEASLSMDYLYNELSTTPQREIRDSINQLIEAQLKTQMLANVRSDYLVRTLDEPVVPHKKSAPYRTLICITFFIAGLFLSITFVLIRFYGFRVNLPKIESN